MIDRRAADWFDIGWAAYTGGLRALDCFPPSGELDAQRHWLGGFGAAWVSNLDTAESVFEALARVLDQRAELMRQLLYQTAEKHLQTLH